MNLGALIPLLKLAQDTGLLEKGPTTTTTIFEEIRPKKVEPGTITVNLKPGVYEAYQERERTKKVAREV